ncbi:hypothetical protein M5K25_002932 [Dendrobium thyrsiflorum]|uniref:Uncharacterized protein n=1 Tax=Dendrobium thyrsiflorum TaxID=117978 RepID=A0ABD0VPV6_DENTH
MVGEWMMNPIKIPWFRHPGSSWSLVYLVRGGSQPNLTEGSLSAAMGYFVQGYLVDQAHTERLEGISVSYWRGQQMPPNKYGMHPEHVTFVRPDDLPLGELSEAAIWDAIDRQDPWGDADVRDRLELHQDMLQGRDVFHNFFARSPLLPECPPESVEFGDPS